MNRLHSLTRTLLSGNVPNILNSRLLYSASVPYKPLSNYQPPTPDSVEYREQSQLLRSQILSSRDRVIHSPMHTPDFATFSANAQAAIEKHLESLALTRRKIRLAGRDTVRTRAGPRDIPLIRGSGNVKDLRHGRPVVPVPAPSSAAAVVARLVIRGSGFLASTTHVMGELARVCAEPPKRILDIGPVPAVTSLACARVFGENFSKEKHGEDGEREHTCLDEGKDERHLAKIIAEADDLHMHCVDRIGEAMRTREVSKHDKDENNRGFDVVGASYALSRLVRGAMSPASPVHRDDRELNAEQALRKKVRELWKCVNPGGALVIVEEGTAAGFETVLFARAVVLNEGNARVVAPCMMSGKCPLQGTIDRHRVCRFVQRFNRPRFQRTADPRPEAFQDEYFSYMILEKLAMEGDGSGFQRNEVPEVKEELIEMKDDSSEERVLVQKKPWGRLVRAPRLHGKHVILDACTAEGALERRVVAKKVAIPGLYQIARKARWGDVWPITPATEAQKVNF